MKTVITNKGKIWLFGGLASAIIIEFILGYNHVVDRITNLVIALSLVAFFVLTICISKFTLRFGLEREENV